MTGLDDPRKVSSNVYTYLEEQSEHVGQIRLSVTECKYTNAPAAVFLVEGPIRSSGSLGELVHASCEMDYLALTFHGAIESLGFRTLAFRASELASFGTTECLAAIEHCE